jgi:hypothetical protein
LQPTNAAGQVVKRNKSAYLFFNDAKRAELKVSNPGLSCVINKLVHQVYLLC